MKLTRFRIQNYKGILDSDWVNVCHLTALVGKNEVGKTSLLQALHKFNPFKPTPYSIAREWPRGLRGARSDAQVVCAAEFELTPDEIKGLQELTAPQVTLHKVQVTKDYAGRFEVLFGDGLFPEKLHPNTIDSLCGELPNPSSTLGDEFRRCAAACRAEALRLAREGRFTELAQALKKQDAKLSASGKTAAQRQQEQDFRDAYLAKLSELAAELDQPRTLHQKAHDYIVRRLPAFVYMDEYLTFCGTAQLDEIKARKERDQLTPEDETFMAILSLAELDFEQECLRAGDSDELVREERQHDLGDAEVALNRKIGNHWGQRHYQVEFRADEYQFMTFVKDARDKALVRLEERSRGFQWFFSFDLMLMHETRGRFKGCVILLDEPGLHLHPEGQRDLLARLEEYSRSNTLIYTTHLPFMLDLREPERIRVISETERGNVVSEDLAQAEPEGKMVLQAALGIGARRGWQPAGQNLLVEGAGEYWILTELSNLFRRSGREGLPPDLLVTPAGGAPETTWLAALMLGEELDVMALFSTEPGGRAAREKLEKSWLPKYPGRKVKLLDLGACAGISGRECCVEDLFSEEFYASRVFHAHEKPLLAAGLTALTLPSPGKLLRNRAEAALQAVNVPFNQSAVCKRLAGDLRKMGRLHELPDQTRRLAENLFQTIAKAASK